MITPQTAYDQFVNLFPVFPAYWEWDDCYREDDGSFTFCGLFFTIADFVRAYGSAFTQEQQQALGAFINYYFQAGGESRDALGACLIEPLDSPESRRTILQYVDPAALEEDPYLSENERRKRPGKRRKGHDK